MEHVTCRSLAGCYTCIQHQKTLKSTFFWLADERSCGVDESGQSQHEQYPCGVDESGQSQHEQYPVQFLSPSLVTISPPGDSSRRLCTRVENRRMPGCDAVLLAIDPPTPEPPLPPEHTPIPRLHKSHISTAVQTDREEPPAVLSEVIDTIH